MGHVNARAPEVQLLADGDILVPVEDSGGKWRMSRVGVDDDAYAEWLRTIQERDRDPGLLARGVSFWVSAVLVFFGFWSFVVITALVLRAL